MTTTWSNIAKGGAVSWTDVPKPSGVNHTVSVSEGEPIGLLLALTYSTTSSVTTGIWTDIAKAVLPASWTNVPKAT